VQVAVVSLALAAVCTVLFSSSGQPRALLLGKQRAQQLVYLNNDEFAGYQGLPSHVMNQKGTEGTWMDGSRGTEHLSHKLFNKLQAAEQAAGIEGDSEGADNYQTGEGLNAPAVQAWKSPVGQVLYQKVQHDADPPDGVDDGVAASGGDKDEAFVDMMDKHPYYRMSAPMSDEQYFDTPPFSTKGLLRLPQLVVRRQMALQSQLQPGLVSKVSDTQQAANEEHKFMREAQAFLGKQDKLIGATPQDQEQDGFVTEAQNFLKGAAAGNKNRKEASPWPWEREERAEEEDKETDLEEKAFEREAQAWLASGADEEFAMPPPSNIFFDDEGMTMKDWAAVQRVAPEEQEGAPGALLLGITPV